MKKKHFALFLIGAIIAACTTATPTTVAPSTRETGEPPETLAVDSLSFSVLGLPDEVTSYERLSIGVASTIPECRFELDAPELLWIETDDQINFEFNAPIVYQPSEEFSIDIRSIETSACPSQTETVGLKVNQGPLKYDDIAPMNIGAISTGHYRVADFGFGGIEITETYTATICYPTPDDCVTSENELLGSDAHNMATGDFNNDGYEDIAVAWALFPHTVAPDQIFDAPIHIYLNDGNGHLYEDTSIFPDGVPPTHPFVYRIVVGDLNGDGIDDVFAGSMGIGVSFEDPSKDYILPYPHLLLLSTEDGRFSDASGNIDDENQGKGLECNFAHDASGGDFDGDGDIDIYACNMLLVNDGLGNFTIHPFIGLQWQQQHQNPMSSLVVDLNNDGYDDLVFWNFDSQPQPEEGLILLSNGTADVAAWQRQELPVGPHGLDHNKYNHAAGGDLNGDGFTDVVVAITRDDPYYEGAYVQILINDGTGALEDQTSTRFPSQARADKHHGEGNIYLRDLEGDGDLDIFHSTNPSVSFSGDSVSVLSGAHIAVNDGNGFFSSVEDDKLPKMPLDWEPDEPSALSKGLPIDIDGRGCLDLVSTAQIWREGYARHYLFAVINTDCEGLTLSAAPIDKSAFTPKSTPPPTPIPPTPNPTPSNEQFEEGFVIYDDSFTSDWMLNPWGGSADPSSTTAVYEGMNAIELSIRPGEGIAFDGGMAPDILQYYTHLVFYFNSGETADQNTYIEMFVGEDVLVGEQAYLTDYVESGPIQPGEWYKVSIPLSVLNPERLLFEWFNIMDASGSGATTFYIDEIRFVTAGP